jgi:hypothetical protein
MAPPPTDIQSDWTGPAEGDWSDNADWSNGVPAAPGTVAVLGGDGTYEVTIASGESFSPDSVTLDNYNATLAVDGTLGTTGGITIEAGALWDSGSLFGPVLDNGGVLLDIGTGPFTLDNSVSLEGGALSWLNTLTGTAEVTVPTGTVFTGFGSIEDATYLQPGYQPGGPTPPTQLVALTNLGTIQTTPGVIGSFDDNYLTFNNASLTNDGLIEANGGDVEINGETFDNASGATLEGIAGFAVEIGDGFTNAGLISETGGELQLGGYGGFAWTNTGTIVADNATVLLGGDETQGDIGTLTLLGTTSLYLIGTLENAGATLNAATTLLAGLGLDDGTIIGGTLDPTGLGMSVAQFTDNVLDGVTVINGLTVTSGGITLDDGSAVYTDASAQTLATIDVTSGGSLSFTGDADYAIAQDVTETDGNVVLAGPFTLTSTIAGTGGMVELGGGFDALPTTWVNDGALQLTDATVDLNGNETVGQIGSIDDPGGTLFYIGGTLDNTGATLNGNDTTLLGLQLDGATIEGGTLDVAGLGLGFDYDYYGQNNDLDNVTVINGLSINGGDVTLTGSSAVYTDATAQTLATIEVGGNGTLGFDGTADYTIGQDVAASGGEVVLTGPFTLDSTIAASGGVIELGGPAGTPATTWVNDGLITLTAGSLELNGNETVAQIGDIANSGGSVFYIGGTLDNVGGTLNGSNTSLLGLQLDGGTIEGGTLDPTALGFGASDLDDYDYYGMSDLDNVAIINNLTVDAPLALTGSTAVYADSSATTPGSIVIDGYQAQVVFAGPGPFTLDNPVTLENGGLTWAASTTVVAAGTMVDATIAAGDIVSGSGVIGNPIDGSTVELTNLGTINANIAFSDLTVAAANLINDGLIETSNNGVVQLGTLTQVYDYATGTYIETVSTLENNGTIALDGGSLVLQADATVAQLGSITNAGGSILLEAGTLDNTGGTLNGSDASLLGLQLDGATIEGGTLDATGLGLQVGYGYSNYASDLDNVTVVNNLTVNGELALTGSTAVYADTSATTPGTITVNYDGQVMFVGPGPFTLDHPVTLEDGNLTWTASTSSSAAAPTLNATIAAGDIVSGYGAIGNAADNATIDLTNLGTLDADTLYETLAVSAASVVNDGLIEASDYASVRLGVATEVYDPATETYVHVASTLVNDGTIVLDNGSLVLDADATVAQLGTIINIGGAIDYQGGTLDNIGGTLNGSDTPLVGLQLTGGTIEGGTLDTTGLGFGVGYGQLSDLDNVTVVDNLTVEGPLALSGSTAVYADTSATTPGSITVDGYYAEVVFVGAGPFTLDNPVTLEQGQLTWAASTTNTNTPATVDVTIAAGEVVTGSGGIGTSLDSSQVDLINLGTIDSNTQYDTLAVQVPDLVNDGLIEASNGAAVQLGEVAQVYDPTTGGYVVIASTLVNNGIIALNNGSLELKGDVTAAQLGTIINSGGTIYYQGGTLDNVGLTLDGGDTSLLGLQLDGGTIEGGTLDTTGLGFGVADLNYQTSGLDNVAVINNLTVDGSLDLSGDTAVYANSSASPGTITVDGYNAAVVFVGPGPFTLDNPVMLENGEVTWATSAGYSDTPTVLDVTIAAGDSVTGSGVIGGSEDNSTVDLANLGTIDADIAGESLAVAVPYLINDRLMEASDGGILQLGSITEVYDPTTGTDIQVAATLINNGTIALDYGSLVLEADATVAQLDSISNTGGVVYFQGGTLDNVGGTLNGSDAPLVGLQLTGGTIEGGTLDTTGLDFVVGYGAGNRSDLDNVTVVNNLTVDGSLDLTGSTAVYADSSATTPGSIAIDGYNAAVVFVGAGPFTLDNPVTMAGGELSWAASTGYTYPTPTLDVTIAAGDAVSGSGEIGNSVDGSNIDLTNLGAIDANLPYNYMSIEASSLDNAGTLIAQNGGVLGVDPTTLVNLAAGTLTGGSYLAYANSNIYFAYNLTVTSDAADIVLSGVNSYDSVETSLSQIASGGTLELDNGAVFTGNQAFSVAGLLTLGGGTLNETSVSVGAGGSLVGFGTIVASNLTGGGLIEAEGGTLTFDAPQSDGATVNVGAFAVVDLTSADNAVVDMSGADSTVILDNGASDFTGTIENFSSGDAIVVNGFAGTSAVFDDGILTLSNSTGSITVNVAGDFAANAFSVNLPSSTESVISLGQPETIAVSAPGTLLDNPGIVIGVSGVTISDSPGATFTVDVNAQYGVLAASPEDGGVAQGNGTDSLILTGDLSAIDAELATLQYQAPAVGTFTDSIAIEAIDNSGGTASSLIAVTIDQPPTIDLPTDVLAQSGTAAAVTGLSITKPDTMAGEIYTVIVTDSAGLLDTTTASGADVIGDDSTSITLSGVLDSVNTELGNLTFTGTANDELTVIADDGRGGLSEAYTPVDVNLPPTLAAPGIVQGFIGIPAPVGGINVSDAYGVAVGDIFTATLVAGLGTLEVTPGGAALTGNDTGTVTVTGSLAAVDTTLASLQYTGPEPGYTLDTIGLSVSDGHGGIASGTIDVIPPPPPALTLPDKFVVGGGLESPLDGITVGVGAGLAGDTMITLDLSDAVGTLGVMWDSGVTVGGNGTNDLVLTGEAGAIDTALASLVYTGGTSLDTSVSLDSLTFTASEDGASTSAVVPVDLPINGDNPSQPQSFAMLLLDSGLLAYLQYDDGNNAYVGTLYADLPAYYNFEPPPTSGFITFSVLNDNIVTATDNASAYQEPYAPVVGDWQTTGPFSVGGVDGFFSTGQLITATDYTLKQPDTITYIFRSTASDAGQLPDRRLTIVFNRTTSVTVQSTPTTSSSSNGGGGGGGGGSGGHGHGDVHLTTYDGLYYNFQAEGEFILSKSTQPGDQFEVQIRLQPWSNSATVSVITEAAVAVGTNQRVTFDVTRENPIWYNGAPLSLTTGGTPMDFGAATLQQTSATSWLILYDSGETVSITNEGSYLDVDTTVPPTTPAGSVEGLLGNDNGNPANDLMLPDGTVLQQPLSSAQLYTTYADAWRVTQSDSLLDYANGQTTTTFTDLSFPSDSVSLANLPANVLENAEALVAAAHITNPAAAEAALEDYLLTGDPSFITAETGPTKAITAEMTTPGTSTTPGLGIAALDPIETISASGTTQTSFEVYLTGTSTQAETVDYSYVDYSYTVQAPGLTEDLASSGTVTIGAGQMSTTLTLDLLGSMIGPTGTVDMMIMAGTTGLPLLASTATVIINNDTAVAGTPALPMFVNAGTIGTLTANAGDTAFTLDLGTILVGATVGSLLIDIANEAIAPADTLTGSIFAGGGGVSFNGGLPTSVDLLAGAIDQLTGHVDTSVYGTIDSSITLNAVDVNGSGFSSAIGPITLDIMADVTCFREGTRILTPDGEIAIEALRVGDTVLTIEGDARPIVWIGRRSVDCRRHPRPDRVWPVRIAADAFGRGLPRRTLWLSPDHAVFVHDVLIPVKHLINGTTIAQQPVAQVRYFHIELEHHEVVHANGLPAETYLDAGDRARFENGGLPIVLHPDFATPDLNALVWEAEGYARLVVVGPEVDAVRAALRVQADRLAAPHVARRTRRDTAAGSRRRTG